MTAKELLYKKAHEKGDGFMTGQVSWIVEAMQENAIQFALWLNTEGWQRYVDEDEWICPAENYNVITTAQLYDKYEKSLVAARPVK